MRFGARSTDIVFTVSPWIKVSVTERQASEDKYGLNSNTLSTAILEALDIADPSYDFKDFAEDRNYVDLFVVVHSGYGAESGPSDGNKMIWSHKSFIYKNLDGAKIRAYNINPALAGVPSNLIKSIRQIAVFCHETGVLGEGVGEDTALRGCGAQCISLPPPPSQTNHRAFLWNPRLLRQRQRRS